MPQPDPETHFRSAAVQCRAAGPAGWRLSRDQQPDHSGAAQCAGAGADQRRDDARRGEPAARLGP